MKTFKLIIALGILIVMSSINSTILASDSKEDVRVRTEENKVKVSLFNAERSKVVVKIYDEQRNVVKNIKLGNGLTPGIILDFDGSEKQYYRLVLVSGKNIVFNNKIKLGTH
ncbi:hypothetical protein [Flagellimonas meridianipacifica]|uniref:Secreted protein (Por secretion system target) n=1 Tax=Flagellimonas meridianipacifica TaxID=1080225 RepID=A0A2T0MJF6_9FLAO|nr:hypothetical protein [Allomuricauda pacifica]PRX57693.1 hypothetical protein CLV81_1703 [Allomuricauda pacifica]